MRELTDRELDAVCGGLLNFFTYPKYQQSPEQ